MPAPLAKSLASLSRLLHRPSAHLSLTDEPTLIVVIHSPALRVFPPVSHVASVALFSNRTGRNAAGKRLQRRASPGPILKLVERHPRELRSRDLAGGKIGLRFHHVPPKLHARPGGHARWERHIASAEWITIGGSNALLCSDLVGLPYRKTSHRLLERIILQGFPFPRFLVLAKLHLRFVGELARQREAVALNAQPLLLVVVLIDLLLAREIGRGAALIARERRPPLVERIAGEHAQPKPDRPLLPTRRSTGLAGRRCLAATAAAHP